MVAYIVSYQWFAYYKLATTMSQFVLKSLVMRPQVTYLVTIMYPTELPSIQNGTDTLGCKYLHSIPYVPVLTRSLEESRWDNYFPQYRTHRRHWVVLQKISSFIGDIIFDLKLIILLLQCLTTPNFAAKLSLPILKTLPLEVKRRRVAPKSNNFKLLL